MRCAVSMRSIAGMSDLGFASMAFLPPSNYGPLSNAMPLNSLAAPTGFGAAPAFASGLGGIFGSPSSAPAFGAAAAAPAPSAFGGASVFGQSQPAPSMFTSAPSFSSAPTAFGAPTSFASAPAGEARVLYPLFHSRNKHACVQTWISLPLEHASFSFPLYPLPSCVLTAATSNLFSFNNPATTGSLFGPTSQPAAAPSMFGTQPAAPANPFGTAAPFGTTAPAAGMFGAPAPAFGASGAFGAPKPAFSFNSSPAASAGFGTTSKSRPVSSTG